MHKVFSHVLVVGSGGWLIRSWFFKSCPIIGYLSSIDPLVSIFDWIDSIVASRRLLTTLAKGYNIVYENFSFHILLVVPTHLTNLLKLLGMIFVSSWPR